MKLKVGFAEDHTGATLKYLILDETITGKYCRFRILEGLMGNRFLALVDTLCLKDKGDFHNITEEEISGLVRGNNDKQE